MTILPKKKATKDKNDPENQEHQHSHSGVVGHPHPHPHQHAHAHSHAHGHALSHPHAHGHYHHSSTSVDSRLEKASRGRTSPPSSRWGPSTSRDEKLHPTLPNTPAFEFDLESHDSSSNHKRRHRSPPHRSVRKHRGAHSGHSSSGQPSPGQSGAYELQDGYNSGDEHEAPRPGENREELEVWFEQALKEKKGFVIKKMGEDGACLFRAVADQIYGDQEMNSMVRNMCIDYMAKNAEFFSQYVTEDFPTYLNRKRMDDCHGNHLEIQAMAELFNRPVYVYQYSLDPMNTFQSTYKTDNDPIRISYHHGVHYNSVVDPYKATIGVGLGLPGYQPGAADRNLMDTALKHSENYHLEKTMLQDKMRETDWELTQESIEEQVARESYLQWLTEQEHASKQHRTPNPAASATCSSASEYYSSRHLEGGNASPEARTSRSPRTRSGQSSPQQPSDVDNAVPGSSKSPRCSPHPAGPMEGSSQASGSAEGGGAVGGGVGGFSETSSLMDHLPSAMYDWEEDDIMAQVMALSHQEYLESLKRKATPSPSPSTSSAPHPHTSTDPTHSTPTTSQEEAGCSSSSSGGFPYCNS